MSKRYHIRGDQIREVALGYGGCLATDRITVDGARVGYMYRDAPAEPVDGGWRFFAGDEDADYMANNANHDVYDVNTIANYDPDVIPFLDAPVGSRFGRDEQGVFRPE